MNKRNYTCARCGGAFESEWSDEEAEQEANALWGNLDKDDTAVICDDCFNAFMRWHDSHKTIMQ